VNRIGGKAGEREKGEERFGRGRVLRGTTRARHAVIVPGFPENATTKRRQGYVRMRMLTESTKMTKMEVMGTTTMMGMTRIEDTILA
jgi:hypothetical protein